MFKLFSYLSLYLNSHLYSYLCWHFNTYLTGDFCPSLVCPGLGLCFEKQLVASHRIILLLSFCHKCIFLCISVASHSSILLLSFCLKCIFPCFSLASHRIILLLSFCLKCIFPCIPVVELESEIPSI